MTKRPGAVNVTSLQYAVGTFCSAMGVLMLVAPHQFNAPAFAWLQGQLIWWGVGFLAAGVGLLIVVSMLPRFVLVVPVHLWAGGLLLGLAAGFVRTGVWSGTAPYLVLGLGTAAAPLLGHLVVQRSWLRGQPCPVHNRLEHALARAGRHNDSLALLFLDLNHFKAINDSLGHEQGDTVLVTVAERLRTCMRTADTAARFGGDEFMVLLEGIDGQDAAVVVAERIGAELARPILLKGRHIVVSASIGIAMHGPSTSAAQLLRQADLAMYRAKRDGSGDGYAVFDRELEVTPTTPMIRPRLVNHSRD